MVSATCMKRLFKIIFQIDQVKNPPTVGICVIKITRIEKEQQVNLSFVRFSACYLYCCVVKVSEVLIHFHLKF